MKDETGEVRAIEGEVDPERRKALVRRFVEGLDDDDWTEVFDHVIKDFSPGGAVLRIHRQLAALPSQRDKWQRAIQPPNHGWLPVGWARIHVRCRTCRPELAPQEVVLDDDVWNLMSLDTSVTWINTTTTSGHYVASVQGSRENLSPTLLRFECGGCGQAAYIDPAALEITQEDAKLIDQALIEQRREEEGATADPVTT